jgi:urea transport system ATP-binding protein
MMSADDVPMLALDSITVGFGGLTVLDDLSLEFGRSPISLLIGPNGAGKTTVFNVLSGIVRPTSGTVALGDDEITRCSAMNIARRGLVRKFQVPTVFPGLSVEDNLRLAARAPRDRKSQSASNTEPFSLDEAAATLRLSKKRRVLAAELSHGERQWLEIGMAFVARPKFLLLDEPAAGLGPDESEHTAELIKRMSSYCRAVVIEHDMHFVRALGGDVTVLHQGKLLRRGSMAEIESDSVVRDVYLGRPADA